MTSSPFAGRDAAEAAAQRRVGGEAVDAETAEVDRRVDAGE